MLSELREKMNEENENLNNEKLFLKIVQVKNTITEKFTEGLNSRLNKVKEKIH